MILLQLFWSFLQVGLFSVGGGYAAMPLIQSQAVTRYGWLTMAEFTDLISIAEMTPGPIAVNSATFVGIRIAGLPGAVAATFGCILPSCILVSLLSLLYARYKGLPAMECILSCLRPVVVALIASAGLTILQVVLFGERAPGLSAINWLGAALFAAAFLVLRIFKKNPILVMACCGAVSLGMYAAFGVSVG